MKIEKPEKTLAFDAEKVNACYEELVAVFQKYKLRIGETLIVYGNLGYTLGASMEGHVGKGPGTETLKQLYYTNPTPGVSLMLTGLNVTTWYDSWSKQQLDKVQDTKEKT